MNTPEIIREDKRDFPNSTIENHEMWIFKDQELETSYVTEVFKKETKLDLKDHHQIPFDNRMYYLGSLHGYVTKRKAPKLIKICLLFQTHLRFMELMKHKIFHLHLLSR